MVANALFIAAFIAVNLINSFRYIFQFGAETSTPTYAAPPLIYLYVKYFLIVLMVTAAILKVKKISFNIAGVYLLASISALVCFYNSDLIYVQWAATSIISYGFIFLIVTSNRGLINIKHLNKVIEFFTFFGLIFLGYQIYRYQFYGVLPAHSHEGLVVRYGSFYDDSLSLGALLPMFAGYFFYKHREVLLSLFTIIIVCSVAVLTGSMTAIGTTFLYVVYSFRKRFDLLLLLFGSVLLLSIGFREEISNLWAFKGGSVEGHTEAWRLFGNLTLLNASGFFPLNEFAESGFLLILYNFGLPILIVILVLHFVTLRACHFLVRSNYINQEIRKFAGATEGLNISVFLISFNLPAIIIFPVYLFLAIFSAIVIRESIFVRQTHKVISPRALSP